MTPVPPPEEDIAIAIGRMLGMVVAAIVLLVGGGIGLILVAALFFRFMYGG
jgi:hypothetical protein